MNAKKKIQPIKGIYFLNKSVLLKKTKTIIFSDFHFGYQEALKRTGVEIPLFQYEETEKEVLKILNEEKPNKVIINGDLKHNFGEISTDEWTQIKKFLEFLKNYSELYIIKGNHDKLLEPLSKKLKIQLTNYYHDEVYSIYICHGDKIPEDIYYKKSKTLIIGHEHPAITLKDGNRIETYKCFLKGKFEEKNLIVMPSFNPISEGTNVLSQKLLSPFLKNKDLLEFNVYIIGNEIYDFGKLKNIYKL